MEAEITVALTRTFTIAGNLTYLKTDQPASALPLRGWPEWSWLAAVEWHPEDRNEVRLSAQHVGDFFDSSMPTGLVMLEGRTEEIAALSYRFSDRVSGTLTARNLLDNSYKEAIGFPSPGRVVRASLVVAMDYS